jgi:flagellar hook protein FlgE
MGGHLIMMRSLYSGVSGLRIHQTKMDVIGNNIANVNTVGFKASSVTFSDVFYQTIQGATGPNETTGAAGQNAKQIGLGSNVASITTSITQTGGSQRTDNPFDVMISGDSFFVVNSGGSNYFTKAGSFNVDANGTLCTATGATVMGWQVDPNDNTKTIAAAVSPLKIMSPENLFSAPAATTNAYISGNIDSKDTQIATSGKNVNVSFYDNMGQSYTAELNVKQTTTATNQYSVGVTDIKGADGKSIFVKESVDAAGVKTYAGTGITSFNFDGTAYTVTVNNTTGAITMAPTTSPTILRFDGATGKFAGIGAVTDTDKSVKFKVNGTVNPFAEIDVDFSSITMYASSGSSSLESTKGSLTGAGAGKKVGNMTGVSIDTAGKIYGKYDNGDSILLGQIAVASFSNPAGLESIGNSMFAETQNSGDFDGIGHDVTSDGGNFTTGVLEMSNVDLSAQFTEMITTQRGFQANSRIITTSDTLLEELINLKR